MTEQDSPRAGRPARDRLAGAAILVAAVAIALDASTFRTSFPTDPVGPRAFPFAAALLLAIGGGSLALRPADRPSERVAGSVWLGAASFVLYALLLERLGFFVTTVSEIVALSMLFGGRPVRSLLAGAAFVGALYLLFASGLGLPLPIGSLFVIGR